MPGDGARGVLGSGGGGPSQSRAGAVVLFRRTTGMSNVASKEGITWRVHKFEVCFLFVVSGVWVFPTSSIEVSKLNLSGQDGLR